VGATSQPLGFPAPLTGSCGNPPAGQAVHTSWLSAAPQRFVTVQTAFASSPASKYRSTRYYPPTACARPTRRLCSPPLSSRPKRPDFFYRAELWRVGPR